MRNKKHLLYPIVSSITALAIGAIFILPTSKDVHRLRLELDQEKTLNVSLENKRTSLSALKSREQEIISDYNLIKIALPDQKAIASLILTVERIAEVSGVSIRSLQVTPGELIVTKPSISQNAEEISFTISYAGPLNSIRGFVDRVHRAKRILSIQTISINLREGSELSANSVIKSYYKPRPESPKAAEEPLPTLTDQDKDTISAVDTLTNFSPQGLTD